MPGITVLVAKSTLVFEVITNLFTKSHLQYNATPAYQSRTNHKANQHRSIPLNTRNPKNIEPVLNYADIEIKNITWA